MTLIHQTKIKGQFVVSLFVSSESTDETFKVAYGADIKDDLTYSEACVHYGAAILHALTCDGRIAADDR